MIIRNFEDSDIVEAGAIAHLTWGDMYADESRDLQNLIYEFMVGYYDLNRKCSFSCIDDGFKGFILAARKADVNNSYEKLKSRVEKLRDKKERQIALELYSYLESCGKSVKEVMNEDDIMLGLFVSIQRGCGRKLIEKLVETCRENRIKNIYLWTDTTCDYRYYQKNEFELVKDVENFVNGRKIGTLIYKKSLH